MVDLKIDANNELSFDFWFYSNSYVTPPHTTLANNKLTLTIALDGRLKLVLDKKYLLDDVTDIECFSLANYSNTTNDGEPSGVYYQTSVNKHWIYLRCGIDMLNFKVYLTNSDITKNEVYYPSNKVSSTLTGNLFIKEESPTNYGFTLIRNFRISSCYDCNNAFSNGQNL